MEPANTVSDVAMAKLLFRRPLGHYEQPWLIVLRHRATVQQDGRRSARRRFGWRIQGRYSVAPWTLLGRNNLHIARIASHDARVG